MTISTRGISVGHDEPAAEFMLWLERRWEELSPTERDSAVFEIRPVHDFFMVGLKWTDDTNGSTQTDRGI